MESFLLVLTLCGSLHDGGNSCEQFIVGTDQSQIECLSTIKAVHNNTSTRVKTLIDDATNDWFATINTSSLECIEEDKD